MKITVAVAFLTLAGCMTLPIQNENDIVAEKFPQLKLHIVYDDSLPSLGRFSWPEKIALIL